MSDPENPARIRSRGGTRAALGWTQEAAPAVPEVPTWRTRTLSCSDGLWVSETRGAFRSAPAGSVVGAVGGGGVLLVTPGWDRGEEKQRMGEGQRKASSGPHPCSAVPPLEDPLCTSSITGGWGWGWGGPLVMDPDI